MSTVVRTVHLVALGKRFGIDLTDQSPQFAVLLGGLALPHVGPGVDPADHAPEAAVAGADLTDAELDLLVAGSGEGDRP